jgi:hypothetical protein
LPDEGRVNENCNAVLVFPVGHHGFKGRGFRDGLAIGMQAVEMKGKRLNRHVPRLVQRGAPRDTARQIRERDAEFAVAILVNKGNILAHDVT